MRQALALCILTLFKFSFVGNLQNFARACFLCLIAFLQSSLYHGLFFFGFVEVFGIHLFDISVREDVKSATRSVELSKFSMSKKLLHNERNCSQLALFSFHLEL